MVGVHSSTVDITTTSRITDTSSLNLMTSSISASFGLTSSDNIDQFTQNDDVTSLSTDNGIQFSETQTSRSTDNGSEFNETQTSLSTDNGTQFSTSAKTPAVTSSEKMTSW